MPKQKCSTRTRCIYAAMTHSTQKPSLKIVLLGIENAHGLVLRVRAGSLEIDTSALPFYREQQGAFESNAIDVGSESIAEDLIESP